MYDTISLDPIPEGVLDGNLAMYDIVPLIYLDGNYYPAAEYIDNDEETVIVLVSNKAYEAYQFKVSNDTIFASSNSHIGIYYDGNLSFFDRPCSVEGNLDGNKTLVDNISLLKFFEDVNKKAIVKLNSHNVNLYDQVQYLPNDVIVVKCDIDGYYEWSSLTANGNFLIKSRFNEFSSHLESDSLGKDHGFISNYPATRNYALQSYFDYFKLPGGYGSATTKNSRTRPLDLYATGTSFQPIQNIIRDLNNEADKYKISPTGLYVKVINDIVEAAYSSYAILQRINELIQAVPEDVDLTKHPEITAPFVFINSLAKPISKTYTNILDQVFEWPWVTTDGLFITLPNSEQRIKGVVKYNADYYWVTLETTSTLHVYSIISMSLIKPGFNFEYYRYKFIVMEEHNRTSKVTI